MKKIIYSFIVLLISAGTMAQSPNSFKYQAVARDANGQTLSNKEVSFQISILQNSTDGSAIYTETFKVTTNQFGLVCFNIGTGTTSDDFTSINWGAGTYFVEVSMDKSGGSSYQVMGTSQLLSVPYALHAKTAENIFSGDYEKLTNKPDLSVYLSISETTDWDKDASDDFDGDYNKLTNKPTIPAVQDLQLNENSLSITNNNTATEIDLSKYLDDTDTKLTDSEIEAMGYLKSADDADADATNEIQNLSQVLTQNNDAGASQIKNIATPTDANDATTKAYVDALKKQIKNEIYAEAGIDDIDGNHYEAVVIGDQIWMAENLRVTQYADGTPIDLVTDNTAWTNLGDNNSDKAYCWFNNDIANKNTYGALYTYAAATNGDDSGNKVQGACPDGWHVPGDTEWQELISFLTADGHSGTEGTAIKSASEWKDGENGTDDYGFNALPAGFRSTSGDFIFFTTDVLFWTATKLSFYDAYAQGLNYRSTQIHRGNRNKSHGAYVRCIRD